MCLQSEVALHSSISLYDGYVNAVFALCETENFMESDSMSESQSLTSGSLPRDLEKSSSSKVVRMGVAFDPSAGPADPDQSSRVNKPHYF